MFPPQCPLASRISHSTALSSEPAITALSTLGDALEWATNRVFDSAHDSTADDAGTLRTADLCLAVGAAAAIAGVWNLGKFLWQEHRMAQAREALAEREQIRQRIVRRPHAIDEAPIGVRPGADAVVFWLRFGHAPPSSAEPQRAALSPQQRDELFNRGSRHGYYAETREAGATTHYEIHADAGAVPLEQRFIGAALIEARQCYDDGFKVGAGAARQWQQTEELG